MSKKNNEECGCEECQCEKESPKMTYMYDSMQPSILNAGSVPEFDGYIEYNYNTSKESVNHPEHYNPGVYEAINVIEHYNLGFHLGNSVKYILRAGKKHNNVKEDIEKAIWYLERYKEKL